MPAVTDGDSQLSVCIIGAGFSGMCAAIKLQRELGVNDFKIYEMNDGLGGTWQANRYPGCECDIPIHGYCFTFEMRAWRAQYATGNEILEYQNELSEKYGLKTVTHLRHAVRRLEWLSSKSQWRVTITDLEKDLTFQNDFDIVISATGSIRVPKIPEEFKGFQGPILHTAKWDSSVDLKGKRIAVVGTGASGIQVIPEMSKVASDLVVFQRKPSWILPKIDFEFGRFLQWIFNNIPFLLLFYQLCIFHTCELVWHAMKRNSFAHKFVTGFCNWHRRRQLGARQDLYDTLTPKYPLGCQRTAFASNYFPVFQKENTTIVTSRIDKIDGNAIITDNGQRYAIDVLVLATGFRITDYFSPLEILDKKGGNVLLEWRKEAPNLYLGVASPKLPNFFFLYGPNSSTGHNSVVVTVEMQMDFIVRALREKMNSKARSICINESVVQDYMTELRSTMGKMVWSASLCSSWYTDEKGRNVSIFPWNLQNFHSRVNKFDYSSNFEFNVA